MSITFGDYKQNGYVVPDLASAIERWAEVGVGPFYRLDDLAVVDFKYNGSTASPSLDVALGNFGDIQVELIQPKDSTPSPYADFLAAHPAGGLHHISVWSHRFDDDLLRWAGTGLVPDCSGEVAGFARFCYFRSAEPNGTAIEVADVGAAPVFTKLSELIQEAARTWDGRDPSRSPDELFARLAV